MQLTSKLKRMRIEFWLFTARHMFQLATFTTSRCIFAVMRWNWFKWTNFRWNRSISHSITRTHSSIKSIQLTNVNLGWLADLQLRLVTSINKTNFHFLYSRFFKSIVWPSRPKMDAVVDALQNSELTAEERELAVKDLKLDKFDEVVGKRKKKMVWTPKTTVFSLLLSLCWWIRIYFLL